MRGYHISDKGLIYFLPRDLCTVGLLLHLPHAKLFADMLHGKLFNWALIRNVASFHSLQFWGSRSRYYKTCNCYSLLNVEFGVAVWHCGSRNWIEDVYFCYGRNLLGEPKSSMHFLSPKCMLEIMQMPTMLFTWTLSPWNDLLDPKSL